jgi:hypothetical protein
MSSMEWHLFDGLFGHETGATPEPLGETMQLELFAA